MFMWHEIESIEHSARNFPTLKAATDVVNGYICTINANGEVAAPAAASTALYVAINDLQGDDHNVEGAKIPAGSPLNLYDLAAWDGREMIATASNITTAMDSISVGDTLKADANGKLSKTGVATIVTFKVIDKIMIGGVAGVRVKVVKGTAGT